MNGTIAIIGFGDQSRVAADILEARGEFGRIACFVDLVPKGEAQPFWRDIPVYSSIEKFLSDRQEPCEFLLARGSLSVRTDLYRRLKDLGYRAVSVVHPSAIIGSGAVIGAGTTICAGAILGVDVVVGEDVLINTSASVDHDCVLGNHVNIAPGVTIAGRARIGDRTTVGAGATIIDEVTIGADCVVAAGAVVISDVPSGSTVMGVPAKPKAP